MLTSPEGDRYRVWERHPLDRTRSYTSREGNIAFTEEVQEKFFKKHLRIASSEALVVQFDVEARPGGGVLLTHRRGDAALTAHWDEQGRFLRESSEGPKVRWRHLPPSPALAKRAGEFLKRRDVHPSGKVLEGEARALHGLAKRQARMGSLVQELPLDALLLQGRKLLQK